MGNFSIKPRIKADIIPIPCYINPTVKRRCIKGSMGCIIDHTKKYNYICYTEGVFAYGSTPLDAYWLWRCRLVLKAIYDSQ